MREGQRKNLEADLVSKTCGRLYAKLVGHRRTGRQLTILKNIYMKSNHNVMVNYNKLFIAVWTTWHWIHSFQLNM